MKNLMSVIMIATSAMAFAQEPAQPAEPTQPPEAVQPAKSPKAKPMRAPRQGMSDRRMMGPGAMGRDASMMALRNPKIVEKLELSDEQKQKIKQLFSGDRQSERELMDKANQASKRQHELMAAEKPDEAAIMAAVDEVFEARKAMAKRQIKRAIDLRSVLTPEQAAKLPEVMKSVRAERASRKPPKAKDPAEANAEKAKPAKE